MSPRGARSRIGFLRSDIFYIEVERKPRLLFVLPISEVEGLIDWNLAAGQVREDVSALMKSKLAPIVCVNTFLSRGNAHALAFEQSRDHPVRGKPPEQVRLYGDAGRT